MILVHVSDNNRVSALNYEHLELPEEVINTGHLVDSIPEPEQIPGKSPILYFDLNTGLFYYEYAENPLTMDEKVNSLTQQVEDLQIALAQVLGV